MDDGYKSPNGYYFCTESFSASDIDILLTMLRTKFGLNCSVHKTTNGPRIYIKSSSIKLFNSLVGEYIIPSFQYKLHHNPLLTVFPSLFRAGLDTISVCNINK